MIEREVEIYMFYRGINQQRKGAKNGRGHRAGK